MGTYIALSTLERYWWGEGEIKFYYDGDREYPSQCSTGMEDYFGGAWSFAAQEGGKTVEQTYCTPFMGYPFYSRDDSVHNPYYNQDLPPQRGFYRWHIPDPIYFEKELRVTCQQIGVSAERGLFVSVRAACPLCAPSLPVGADSKITTKYNTEQKRGNVSHDRLHSFEKGRSGDSDSHAA